MNLKILFINHCEDHQYEINQNQLDVINYLKIYYTKNFTLSLFSVLLIDPIGIPDLNNPPAPEV